MVEASEFLHDLLQRAKDVRIERVSEDNVVVVVLVFVDDLGHLLELPTVACAMNDSQRKNINGDKISLK